ncbi:MAG: hypothetical protein GY953_07940 [bacterium]|nr:hypothetical protein [bacterium]
MLGLVAHEDPDALGHDDRDRADRTPGRLAEVDESLPREAGGGEPSEGEDIEVIEKSFEEAWEMLRTGEIVDAKTLIGLQWLRASR